MWNKASKKTRKPAEEPVVATPETATAEITGTPRLSRSSKPKKNDTNETASAKHHRIGVKSLLTPETQTGESSQAAKSMVAAAGAGTGTAPSSIVSREAKHEPTHEEIATLAYSYWVERGDAQGSPEEDWARAERELKGNR